MAGKAFGIFDHSMIPKIRRLLKPHGLDLRVKQDRRNWGDQVEVSIVERIAEKELVAGQFIVRKK